MRPTSHIAVRRDLDVQNVYLLVSHQTPYISEQSRPNLCYSCPFPIHDHTPPQKKKRRRRNPLNFFCNLLFFHSNQRVQPLVSQQSPIATQNGVKLICYQQQSHPQWPRQMWIIQPLNSSPLIPPLCMALNLCTGPSYQAWRQGILAAKWVRDQLYIDVVLKEHGKNVIFSDTGMTSQLFRRIEQLILQCPSIERRSSYLSNSAKIIRIKSLCGKNQVKGGNHTLPL